LAVDDAATLRPPTAKPEASLVRRAPLDPPPVRRRAEAVLGHAFPPAYDGLRGESRVCMEIDARKCLDRCLERCKGRRVLATCDGYRYPSPFARYLVRETRRLAAEFVQLVRIDGLPKDERADPED
jgi:hypothetical protein